MKTLPALVCLLLISSVGCGQQQDKNPAPAASAPPAVPVETPAAGSVTAPATPNSTAAPAAAIAAGDESESVDEQTPVQLEETAKDSVNTRLAAAVAPATVPEKAAPESRWKEGENYKRLIPAQPTDAPPGKVEVVEVFWYGCSHCYGLEPYIDNWNAKKAPYIEFTRLPVVWGAGHQAHARFFYTLAALGRQDLHSAVFRETQVAGNMLVAQDPAASENLQAAFAKRHGIKEEDFRKAYRSFEVETKVQRAADLTRRYRIEGVPTFVINGKYVADVGSAGGQSRLMELIGDLAKQEHKKE